MESPAPVPFDQPIVCHVTPWYFRRMSLMAAMLALMGLWFLYDGKYGYHAANEIADKKDWFEQVLLKGYDDAKAAGTLEQWVKDTEAAGHPAGKNGEPPRWVSYAAEHGWDEKPHRWSDREIHAQFWYGGVTLAVGLIVAGITLWNRKKTLRAGADHWITPEGKTIRFSDVFRVDTRKWDNKGLAYAWYKDPASGAEKKAIIDDLKFAGAAQILARLTTCFKGELIEKQPDPPPPSEASAEQEN